ncbi:hypothetical protein SLS58_005595 [Diplodia intermedia]|uniref:Uncharacterized protein n=1 Tax=Diplodia intermedia TaxID=856260 RepID=A0ABR3TQJ7_9PEZI
MPPPPPHAFPRRSHDTTTATTTTTTPTPTPTEIAELAASISSLFRGLRRDYFAAITTTTTTTTTTTITAWRYYDVRSRANRVFLHVFLEGIRGEQLRAIWLPVAPGDDAAARARQRARHLHSRIVPLQQGLEELEDMVARRDREDRRERERARERRRERRRVEGGNDDDEFLNGVDTRRLGAAWDGAFGPGDPNLSLVVDEDDEDDEGDEDDGDDGDDEDDEDDSFASLIEKGVVKPVDREEVEAKESVCCDICHAPWVEMTSEHVREKEGEDWAKWFCKEPYVEVENDSDGGRDPQFSN